MVHLSSYTLATGGSRGEESQRETAEGDIVVVDSLQVDKDGSLAVSGTSLVAKGHSLTAGVGGSADEKVGQAPPTSQSQQQVVRKQKKQLRQLR